ncbi:Membrane protein of unknown function [Lentilactobacillus parabuchneri]|nr:Membrane protein of unknown function [Lentilactobacillus parabuchneri]
MRFLTTVLVDTILFMAISGFFPANFYVASVEIAVIAAFVLAVLNWLVRPVITQRFDVGAVHTGDQWANARNDSVNCWVRVSLFIVLDGDAGCSIDVVGQCNYC